MTALILHKKDLSPEEKIYLIARELRQHSDINMDLWYAILELKEKHFDEFMKNGILHSITEG